MSENALRAGVGYFQFVSNDAPLTMRVFYACPHSDLRKAPIIIAMHGMDRAAEAFRNDMAAQALKNGQIVLVPEFDVQRSPDHFAYNFGGVVSRRQVALFSLAINGISASSIAFSSSCAMR